jgi:hypothetical protein
MNELAIYEDEAQMRIAIETINLYQEQIKNMESEVDRIKKLILTAMQENGLKIVEVAGAKFNRITPSKKVLDQSSAEAYLIKHDLLNSYMILDTKKVMGSFPQFVAEDEGTEYLKISEVKQ